MKNIKDYLHLYLGCDCLYNERSALPNERFVLTIGNVFWAQSHTDEFKLILRPLSSMTEDEKDSLIQMYVNTPDNLASAERVRYLLSKHFDLFGLIEAGLAIDATKTDQYLKRI